MADRATEMVESQEALMRVLDLCERWDKMTKGPSSVTVQIREAINRRPDGGPPGCVEHKEVQHRDGKPRWCNACGWNWGHPMVFPQQYGKLGD